MSKLWYDNWNVDYLSYAPPYKNPDGTVKESRKGHLTVKLPYAVTGPMKIDIEINNEVLSKNLEELTTVLFCLFYDLQKHDKRHS